MEVAARELIPALIAQAPAGTRFTAFVSREAAAVGRARGASCCPPSPCPCARATASSGCSGEQTLLPPLAARAGVDLVHSLASTAPVWGRFQARRDDPRPDLRALPGGPRRNPRQGHAPARAGRRAPLRARDRDSNSTREDIICAAGRTRRAHRRGPAGPRDGRARHAGARRRTARAPRPRRAGDRADAVGQAPAQEPRAPDRRARAARAGAAPAAGAARLPDRARGEAAGTRADAGGRATTCASSAGSSGAELEGLWALASAFVFPSLCEGFGLPVLEAMARGVPVACSNASSLPEVAGEAALLFDPLTRSADRRRARAPAQPTGELAARLRERGRAAGGRVHVGAHARS